MKLITEIQDIKKNYKGTIEITDGLSFSQYETLRTIEFYTNSKFTGPLGNKDSLGKEKPFYNIVNTMVDTAVVATDIDTKDIRVEAEREQDFDKSFMYNHEIQKWMKETNFAEELNEMGETRARYGGVVVKKCMYDGDMEIEVVEWKNLYTDPTDVLNNTIIECHYLSPMELRAKKDVWSNVDEALKLYSKKGYTSADAKIEVLEVHGEFPTVYLSEEDEADGTEVEYSKQIHYYAVKNNKAVHLYWSEEKELPYKYLPWKKRSGRALGAGVVEEGDEAQVWTNDAVQKEQSAMEFASKIIGKTNSKKIGKNLSTDYDNGSVMVLEEGKEFEILQLLPAGLPTEFQNLITKWWSQYERTTSAYDAVRGETPPSGQPYRLQQLVANQGGSHFDYRREEWGIFLTELFQDWVFPWIEKRINKKHILASDFSPEELARLDEHYAKYHASNMVKDKILSGEMITREDYLSIQSQFQDMISKTGKRRFLDVPDGYYKDMKAKLTINITGEQKNKMATLESLNSVLQSFIPLMQSGIASPEDVQMVINKILELSGAGISPMSLKKGNTQVQQPQAAQQQQPVASGIQNPMMSSNLMSQQ